MIGRRRAGPVDFIAIVPSRRASTRLPDKPLADIGGKPMVVHVVERAARSGASLVIAATDDEAIADAVRAHGHEAMLTSSTHLSGTDRIAEVAARLVGDGTIDRDTIVVNVQGDEPLIDPLLIAAAARTLAGRPECEMATACHPIASREAFVDPNVVKVVVDAEGRALYFSRAPIPWARDHDGMPPPSTPAMRHIGLYAYRAGFLATFTTLAPAPLEMLESLEQLRALWHGYRIAVFVAASAPAAGVDTAADLDRVRAHVAAATHRADADTTHD